MSIEKKSREANRWFLQAVDDFEAAESLAQAKRWPQALFFLHQASEKAIKSLHFLFEEDPWGHSIQKLISELPDEPRVRFDGLKRSVLLLDRLYIPTRYPDAVPELTPKDVYTEEDFREAHAGAKEVLLSVQRELTHHGSEPVTPFD